MRPAHEAEQAARGKVADGDFVHGGLLSVKAVNEVADADQFAPDSVLHLGPGPVVPDLPGGRRLPMSPGSLNDENAQRWE